MKSVWITDGGRTYQLKELSDEHLVNILNMAEQGKLQVRVGVRIASLAELRREALKRKLSHARVMSWGAHHE